MSRIATPLNVETSPEASRPLLEAVGKKLGSVPNIFRLIGNSPKTLEGYLGLSGALAGGTLSPATREAIALTLANVNGCDYCNSAHTFLAKNLVKVADAEIAANRNGASNDPKIAAAVAFARKVAVERGNVSESDLDAVRAAGYSDAELVEIVGNVAVNVLTNYVNEVFKTEVDFPRVEPARRAA